MPKIFTIIYIALLSILNFSVPANAQWSYGIAAIGEGMQRRAKEIEAERRADRELELRARELDILERSLQQRIVPQIPPHQYPTTNSAPVTQVQTQRILRDQWCPLPNYYYQAHPAGGVTVWDGQGYSVHYSYAQLVNGTLYVYAKC